MKHVCLLLIMMLGLAIHWKMTRYIIEHPTFPEGKFIVELVVYWASYAMIPVVYYKVR